MIDLILDNDFFLSINYIVCEIDDVQISIAMYKRTIILIVLHISSVFSYKIYINYRNSNL